MLEDKVNSARRSMGMKPVSFKRRYIRYHRQQKESWRGRFRKFIQNLLLHIFAFVGMLVVLNWSIGVFQDAAVYYLSPPVTEQIDNTSKADDSVKAESIAPVGTEVGVGNTVVDSQPVGVESLLGIFTAYNAEAAQTDSSPTIMASGKTVYDGAIANNCLPFGTKVKIDGEVKTVEDRMNSRYGCDYFDIFMFSYQDAIHFGKREMKYEIL